MTASSYPWINLLVYFEDLMRRLDLPATEAFKRIAGAIHAGRLEIRPLFPTRSPCKLRLWSRDRLKVETPDGFLDADKFEVRDCPIIAEPGLLGPTVPMPDATRERFEARLRELGGALVISSSGVGFMLPTVDEPSAAPVKSQEPDKTATLWARGPERAVLRADVVKWLRELLVSEKKRKLKGDPEYYREAYKEKFRADTYSLNLLDEALREARGVPVNSPVKGKQKKMSRAKKLRATTPRSKQT